MEIKSIKNKPNYTYSILSVALVLFLLGFFSLFMLQAQKLVVLFKEKVSIFVELKEATSVEQVDALKQTLKNEPFLKAGSLKYTNKEKALEIMVAEEFGQEILDLELANPFYDMLSFNIKSDYLSPDILTSIRSKYKQKSFVNDVFYQENLIDDIERNIKNVGWLTFFIGVFFLIITITLIHNTIRLAMYANRFLIKSMQLVGASWSFISRPYLLKSFYNGLISSLLALAALSITFVLAKQKIPELSTLQSTEHLFFLCLMLVVLGISITTLSTYYTINKYLKMRIEDLY